MWRISGLPKRQDRTRSRPQSNSVDGGLFGFHECPESVILPGHGLRNIHKKKGVQRVGSDKYKVVFDSRTIKRWRLRWVKKNLAARFRLDEKKLERLFSNKSITVKRNISFERALRIRRAIEESGGTCRIKSMGPALGEKAEQDGGPPANQGMSPRPPESWFDLARGPAESSGQAPRCTDGVRRGSARCRRQAADRRVSGGRRLEIHLREDRRSGIDRRADNQAWVGDNR